MSFLTLNGTRPMTEITERPDDGPAEQPDTPGTLELSDDDKPFGMHLLGRVPLGGPNMNTVNGDEI